MKNYLTDVEGIKVGHAQDYDAMTGCTVIICEEGASGGIDVRGSAPGTRETDIFKAEKLVDKVHAVVLSGGSAFGLEASSGVANFLEEKDIGFDVGVTKVPIVSQAVLFDLVLGDHKVRPDKEMGYQASLNASVEEDRRGNIGAGTGATVGKAMGPDLAMKGGLGSASIQVGDLVVSALVAVNAVGDIYDKGRQIAGPYNKEENRLYSTMDYMKKMQNKIGFENTNTTIGVVATNANLSKAQANKMAQVAHNGYARAINPVHTMSDGDSIFAMATNKIEANMDLIIQLAAEVMEKAIVDGIKNASSYKNTLSWQGINK